MKVLDQQLVEHLHTDGAVMGRTKKTILHNIVTRCTGHVGCMKQTFCSKPATKKTPSLEDKAHHSFYHEQQIYQG